MPPARHPRARRVPGGCHPRAIRAPGGCQAATWRGVPGSDLAVVRWARGPGSDLAVVRFGQVLDALDGRVLRPGIAERREQLARELLRHVHAGHDDTGHVAFLDLVVEPGERDRELVVREGDVREVGIDAGEL